MLAPEPTNAVWQKSSYSNGGGNQCVEVATFRPGPALRDSKAPRGGALRLSRDAWAALAGNVVTPGESAGQ